VSKNFTLSENETIKHHIKIYKFIDWVKNSFNTVWIELI